MQVTVTKSGPYLVSGNIPLILGAIVADKDGNAIGYREAKRFDTAASYALCRCGASTNKPFCDGAHAKVGFAGSTTAPHVSHASLSKEFKGHGVTLFDAYDLCISAAFCDVGLKVWGYTAQSEDPAKKKKAIEQACLCPSGRLVMHDAHGTPIEPTLEPSIMVLEDPSRSASSTLWVRGSIPVIDEAGSPYEIRNRQTICRCGQSQNKPFCDGQHYRVGFNDGLRLG